MKFKTIRRQYYFLNSLFTTRYNLSPSSEEIDVIIPVIEKDIKILPLCFEGVKESVTNRIKSIYIIAPPIQIIEDFCKANDLIFVNENEVLGFSPKEINYVVNGQKRGGWIFQQLLKLNGNVGTCKHFLVIDADHILIKPHTFLTDKGKTVFYRSKEYHPMYYRMMEKLIGTSSRELLSYVDHKMLFSKDVLNELKARVESHCGCKWVEAILSNLDYNDISCFSEYETYGCLFPTEDKVLLPWRNKNLTMKNYTSYRELQDKYGKHHLSVTFPDYKNK